jgi:hypothetical protein
MTAATWRCNRCGFEVPVDNIGRAIMLEHLREHRKQDKKEETQT